MFALSCPLPHLVPVMDPRLAPAPLPYPFRRWSDFFYREPPFPSLTGLPIVTSRYEIDMF